MKHNFAKYLFGGAAVGALNGLFGGGGGMVAVPVLRAAGRDERRAHATAIAIVLPASLLSGAVYLFSGAVPLPLLLPAGIGSAAGGIAGAKLLRRSSPRLISFLFALFMFAAGIRMML